MNDEQKRELVIRLAERVMGWTIRTLGARSGEPRVLADEYEDDIGCVATYGLTENTSVRKWRPLENIADAWMLVDALMKRGLQPEIGAAFNHDGWACSFFGDSGGAAEGETAAEAICLAASAAVGDK